MVNPGVDDVEWGEDVYKAVDEECVKYEGYAREGAQGSNWFGFHPRAHLLTGYSYAPGIHSAESLLLQQLTLNTVVSILSAVVRTMPSFIFKK